MESVFLSSYGEDIVSNLSKHDPDPVLLIGDTGWGKTTLLKHYAAKNDREFTGVNFFPKQSVDQLVGMWRPINGEKGISIEWQDGLLTDAIRNGKIFLGEELTRAPRDLAGRMLGILDSADRYWSLPEAGVPNVPVADGFWFLASANPTSGNYATVSLDPALARRFSYICQISEPIADELKLITALASSKIQDADDFAKRMVAWATDLRKGTGTKINTGDLRRVGSAIVEKQIAMPDAVEQTLGFKYQDIPAMLVSMGAHFETFDLRFDKQSKKAVKEAAAVAEIKAHVEHNEAIEEAKPVNANADLLAQLQALLAGN